MAKVNVNAVVLEPKDQLTVECRVLQKSAIVAIVEIKMDENGQVTVHITNGLGKVKVSQE